MNLLLDLPPETVDIGGAEYRINTDFRASILFELLMQDDDVNEYEKIIQSLQLYFEEYPEGEDIVDVFKAIVWFYRCGRNDKERKRESSGDEDGGSKPKRAYSFDYDDEYIYAAFRQQYGINLATVKYLHWWEFRAMFKALDHDCEFVKIMGYRTTKITKDMSKTEKAFLRKMKSVHALPVSEREREETDALVNALMNGGDLTGLLGDDGGNGEQGEEDAG